MHRVELAVALLNGLRDLLKAMVATRPTANVWLVDTIGTLTRALHSDARRKRRLGERDPSDTQRLWPPGAALAAGSRGALVDPRTSGRIAAAAG